VLAIKALPFLTKSLRFIWQTSQGTKATNYATVLSNGAMPLTEGQARKSYPLDDKDSKGRWFEGQEILDRQAICHYISAFYRKRRLSVVRPAVSLR